MSEKIDHKTIKMQQNYLLIKPDLDMDKYHLDGKETSIYVGISSMVDVDPEDSLDFTQKETMSTHADHWSITGTVIAAPKSLVFYGSDIKRISSRSVIYDEDIVQMNRLADASLKYASSQDVKEGDRVMFDALVHLQSYELGNVIETDIGDLYMVKYDRLIGVFKNEEVVPLNSVVFFRWHKKNVVKLGGLALDFIEKDIWDADHSETMIGEIVGIGKYSPYYINGCNPIKNTPIGASVGDKFLFKSIDVRNVENQGHYHFFNGELIYMIRDFDIQALIDN